MSEENDYVICMVCQNSFHMDECEPIGNSGYGFVYCKGCRDNMITAINVGAEIFYVCKEHYPLMKSELDHMFLIKNEYKTLEHKCDSCIPIQKELINSE